MIGERKGRRRPVVSRRGQLRMPEFEHRQLLSIFDSIDEAVYVADPKTYEVLYANRALRVLFGDVVGTKCYRKFQNLRRPCRFCTNKRIFGRNVGRTCVWEFKNRVTGRWYHCVDRAIRWPDGRLVRYEMAMDITERRETEEALRASEEKLRTLSENINVGLYRNTPGPKGEFLEANPALVRMFGYEDREEFLKHHVSELYRNPSDRRRFNQKMLKQGSVRGEELELKRADGTTFIGWVSAVAVKDVRGKVECFDGIIDDITERKRMEKALRESEETYRALVATSPDAVIATDLTGRITFASQRALELHGADRAAELLGKNSLELIVPKDRARAVQNLKRTLEAGFVRGAEYHMVRRDGSCFIGEVSAALLRDPAGKPREFIGVVRDITVRKKAEQALKEYSERLEEMVEKRTQELRAAQEKLVRRERLTAIEKLTGMMAHELRNPLSVILNATYYLRRANPDPDPGRSKYLALIDQEANDAARIISELVKLTRVGEQRRSPIRACDVLDHVLDEQPAPAGIAVARTIAEDLPTVQVDSRHLEQALGNLVANAYQAMAKGGKLTLAARFADGRVRLSVSDTGPGIPPDALPKLFEPFFTTKGHGLGLGLAIARELVEANGGTIEVAGAEGKGSTFTVVLPAASTPP